MRRRAVPVLFGLGLVLALLPLALFTVLTVNGGTGWNPVDSGVSKWAHRVMSGHPHVTTTLDWLGHLTEPIVERVIATVIGVVLWVRGRRRVALWLVGTMWIGGILAIIGKQVVQRARPDFADPVAYAPGYAFPSGHAAGSFLFAGCLLVLFALRRPRAGAEGTTVEAPARRLLPAVVLAVAFVLLVAGDRLLLAVHYVTDILGGWSLSAVVLLVSLAVARPWLERRS